MVASERGVSVVSTAQGREIWELLLELSRTHLRERLAVTIAAFDLSLPQAHALQVLEPGRPLPMRDLALRLHCDASNITGIVDRLEARGLVERRADPRDRRIWRLQLTPAAGPVLREIAQYRAELHDIISAGLDPATLKIMTDGLLQMKVNLAAEARAPAGPVRPPRPRTRNAHRDRHAAANDRA